MILRIKVRIKQQRIPLRPPGILIPNPPHSNPLAVRLLHARAHNALPIARLRILDIDFSESALRGGGAKCGHGGGGLRSLARLQVALRADTVDGDASGDPFFDIADHALGFAVVGGVEAVQPLTYYSHHSSYLFQQLRLKRARGVCDSLVVIDIQFALGIRLLGRLESNADKVLAEDVVEDGAAEGAVFVEDLVDDVPVVHFAGVAAHELVDVVLHYLGEGVLLCIVSG